jgi:signal transduction histidine kinase
MTGARYGAIGVFDSSGTAFEYFVAVGLTPAEIEPFAAWSAGMDASAQLTSDPRPQRMVNLGRYPKASKPPSDGLPTTSSLGVPIGVRQVIYGHFHLTDKVGWPCFTDDDHAVVEALASAVGTAIESTRLRAIVAAAALAQERDRRAKDLHDLTIQRLFGLGLSLQAMIGDPTPEGISKELTLAVARIDAIIHDVQNAIHELDLSTESSRPMT